MADGEGARSLRFHVPGLSGRLPPLLRDWRRGGCSTYDTVELRRWRHLGHGKIPFWFEYTPRRTDCERCGVLVEKLPWARPSSRFTRDFEELAAYLAQKMTALR
jgi:transposase